MRKIVIFAVVALVLVATCTAIEQPHTYKNVKPPAWYLDSMKNQSQGNPPFSWQNAGVVMPDLSGLKALQAKHR